MLDAEQDSRRRIWVTVGRWALGLATGTGLAVSLLGMPWVVLQGLGLDQRTTLMGVISLLQPVGWATLLGYTTIWFHQRYRLESLSVVAGSAVSAQITSWIAGAPLSLYTPYEVWTFGYGSFFLFSVPQWAAAWTVVRWARRVRRAANQGAA